MRRWLIVSGVLVCACAGAEPAPMSLPPVRYQQPGFSFVPLDEPGWFVAPVKPEQITLATPGKRPGEMFVIQGLVVPLPEGMSIDQFMRDVRADPGRAFGSERFATTSHVVEPVPAVGDRCMRAHTVSEDSGVDRSSASRELMVLEAWTILCPAPGDFSSFIMFGYSARFYPSQRDPRSDARAAQVLDSFRLSFPQPGGG